MKALWDVPGLKIWTDNGVLFVDQIDIEPDFPEEDCHRFFCRVILCEISGIKATTAGDGLMCVRIILRGGSELCNFLTRDAPSICSIFMELITRGF